MPATISPATRFGRIVAQSASMLRVIETARQLAELELPVLVTGESGVGKELVARALHQHSLRADQPFVAINCAALPRELAESELFGHVRGAYTGATAASEGAFASAHGGTLFLDEVGELPLQVQPKLLRALDAMEVRAVGAPRARDVDVRVIAATNRSLESMTGTGEFRGDLFYRLDILRLEIPPLRSRLEDLPAIARELLRGTGKSLDTAGLRALRRHDWPGNVRELRNVLLRAAATCEGELDEAAILRALPPLRVEAPSVVHEGAMELTSALLAANGGNRKATYRQLGLSKSTFYRWMRSGKIRELPEAGAA